MTGDLYLYAAAAGVAVFALIIPTLTWILTRAWYSGRIEDLTAQVRRLDESARAADAVIKDAEQQGYIQTDQPQGRHAR